MDTYSKEPGSEDNRLSLDPHSPEWEQLLENWQDGETYNVMLSIEQLSPGEFKVLSMKEHAAEEAPEEAEPGEGTEETPDNTMKYGNPAVQRLMDKQ